MKMQQKILI
jgi:hypothetical protein